MLAHAEFATLVVLIGCSILALAVVLERALSYKKTFAHSRSFKSSLRPLLEAADEEQIKTACGQSDAPLAATLAAIWEVNVKLRPEQTEILLRQALDSVSLRLRRFLAILATLAGTAPFIGLFGTVLGIMHTFADISRQGFGGPAAVSAGISQALVATAAGLAVAIPSVIFYNVYTRKVNGAVKEVEADATQILIMLDRM